MFKQEVDAINIYISSKRLSVQPHVIERAVRALSEHKRIEALALIRGAYTTDEGVFASLDEAKMILASIMARR